MWQANAGIAQLVERNLAKVEVESSRLFSRSNFEKGSLGFPFFLVRRVASFSSASLWTEMRQGIARMCCPGYAAMQVCAQQPAPRW